MSIIYKIKNKKELRGLSDSVVQTVLEEYLSKNHLSLSKISNLSEKEEKAVIKSVRAELRNLTGQFQKSSKNRISLLESNSVSELLRTHTSTEERLEFYPQIISKISTINPKSILDLGCGLNPLAFFFFNKNKKLKYFASDIKQDELSLIGDYFRKNKIEGETFIYDLRFFSPKDLPKVDLVILFKVLDVIEKKSHTLSEKIVSEINAKHILVSFATKKLSGKPMNFPQRNWFRRILEKHNLKYETFSHKNEFFYLIKKSNTNKISPS